MQFALFIVFLSLYVSDRSKLSGFSLDYTDRLLNGLDRDCLYYNAHEREDKVFQLIAYCIRFQPTEPVANNRTYHSWFTFDDLRQSNITSHQLYTWSAPVDLIEHYRSYLKNKNSSSNTFLFYNCTYPWFGSRCEYSFDHPESNFTEQVEISFETKRLSWKTTLQKISCYMHLQCDRAGDRGQTPGACLDWREVCDGKVDCIDGGHDEEQCWQLEINECDNETEYRCHIRMCIPLEFLGDDANSADCLDPSDEDFTGLEELITPIYHENEDKDLVKPIFRFEEHICYSSKQILYSIESGYLVCLSIDTDSPLNPRAVALQHASIIGANVTENCYKALTREPLQVIPSVLIHSYLM